MWFAALTGVVIAALLVLAVGQGWVVAIYCRYMRPPASGIAEDRGHCAVLMALRGADPGLATVLRCHLEQDLSDYHLHLIIDSLDDPAWHVIQRLPAALRNRWTVHQLKLDRADCGLKNLGLAQVAESLLALPQPPRYFAFADGDGQVSRDWLQRLLAPLHEDTSGRIVAATGHRWYLPAGFCSEDSLQRGSVPAVGEWGTLVRYFWNLGSLPQMHLYQVAWGGSWAIKGDGLRTSGLLGAWRTSLFEDTMIGPRLQALGGRVVTVPGLLAVNADSLSLAAACHWIQRQLLDMRLYHPAYPRVVGHALSTATANLLAAVLLVMSLWSGPSWAVWGLASAMLLYQLAYAAMWWSIVAMASTCLAELDFPAGHPAQGVRAEVGARWDQWATALVLTQLTYPWAAWQSLFQRQVEWRGIRYRIRGPYDIARDNYRPWAPASPCESLAAERQNP